MHRVTHDRPESSHQVDPLVHRVSDGADVVQTADAIIEVWQEIHATLVPIIGQGGVAALFKRSAYLSMRSHPWLAAARDSGPGAIDFVALKSLLIQQAAVQALAGGRAMLQTFYGLLASLVGDSLTEQLLRSVWHPPTGQPPTQDPHSWQSK